MKTKPCHMLPVECCHFLKAHRSGDGVRTWGARRWGRGGWRRSSPSPCPWGLTAGELGRDPPWSLPQPLIMGCAIPPSCSCMCAGASVPVPHRESITHPPPHLLALGLPDHNNLDGHTLSSSVSLSPLYMGELTTCATAHILPVV